MPMKNSALLIIRLGLMSSVLCLPGFAGADDAVLGVKMENDIIAADSDGHYSNGVEVAYSFVPDEAHWTRSMAESLGWSAANLDVASYRFGHQIYTPDDIEIASLIEDDRPYAGLAYAGLSLFQSRDQGQWRDSRAWHMDLGLAGPGAGGERFQRAVHRATSSDEPKGWDNQLENEPFFNMAYGQRWWRQSQLGPLELEYGPALGAAVGNLYTYASSGLGLRFGKGLARSLGLPSINPGYGSGAYFEPDQSFAWFGYINLDGRYMAHNMLLDGNTFSNSHSVDREQWVGDLQAGVALTWERWQVSFASVWRTREFKGQTEPDQFGSLVVARAF